MVSADPDSMCSVSSMEEHSNITVVRRLLGMVNHLGKFLLHLVEITDPLRDLLKSNLWSWGRVSSRLLMASKKN